MVFAHIGDEDDYDLNYRPFSPSEYATLCYDWLNGPSVYSPPLNIPHMFIYILTTLGTCIGKVQKH